MMTEPRTNLTTAGPEQWAIEQRRRYLLKTMGITPVVSRRDWPGARAPERFAAPAPSVPEAAPVDNIAAGLSPAAKPAAKPRPSMPEPRPSTATPAARKPARQPAATLQQANAASAVQFSLLIAAGAGYLWIEALPERVLANEQLSLTTALARALDGGAAPLVYQQFDWPIVANPALPRDIETAKQSLGALLGRMRKEQAPRGVVLMGECEVLPDLGQAELLRIPATLAMLENSALKADAWSVLKTRVTRA